MSDRAIVDKIAMGDGQSAYKAPNGDVFPFRNNDREGEKAARAQVEAQLRAYRVNQDADAYFLRKAVREGIQFAPPPPSAPRNIWADRLKRAGDRIPEKYRKVLEEKSREFEAQYRKEAREAEDKALLAAELAKYRQPTPQPPAVTITPDALLRAVDHAEASLLAVGSSLPSWQRSERETLLELAKAGELIRYWTLSKALDNATLEG